MIGCSVKSAIGPIREGEGPGGDWTAVLYIVGQESTVLGNKGSGHVRTSSTTDSRHPAMQSRHVCDALSVTVAAIGGI